MNILTFGQPYYLSSATRSYTVRQVQASGKVLVCLSKMIPKDSYLTIDSGSVPFPIIPLKPLFIDIKRTIELCLYPTLYNASGYTTVSSSYFKFAIFDNLNEYMYFQDAYHRVPDFHHIGIPSSTFSFYYTFPITTNPRILFFPASANCACIKITNYEPGIDTEQLICYMAFSVDTNQKGSDCIILPNNYHTVIIEQIYKTNPVGSRLYINYE